MKVDNFCFPKQAGVFPVLAISAIKEILGLKKKEALTNRASKIILQ